MNLAGKASTAVVLLLVIYVFLDAIAFSAQNSAVKTLGHRRKALVLLTLGIGLATSFGTLVVIDPAVMGRSQWSALDMAKGIWDGTFPPLAGAGLGITLIDLALVYLLMLYSLVVFCFSDSRKLLKIIGLIGCLLSLETLGRGEQSFKRMFFGLVPVHGNATIDYGAAMYLVPLIMSALVLISTVDSLDI
ncbi:MAG: hypothetical protein ACM3SP_25915 [Chloroflexota bacterium]